MLRPRAARWFEILAARDDATLVLEALARTGAVELQARASATLPESWSAIAPLLADADALAARCQAYWPAPAECRPSPFPEAPVHTLQRCLAALRAWHAEAEPTIQALQAALQEQQELLLWQQVLPALPQPVDPALLAQAGPWFGVRLFVLPPGSDALALLPPPGEGVAAVPQLEGQPMLLVAATPAALQALAQAATAMKATVHPVPVGLLADPEANAAMLAARLADGATAITNHRSALAALNQRHELPRALGDVHRLQWVLQNVQALEAGEWLCWITGWSSDASGALLAPALQQSGARALLHFAPPPAGLQPPLLLDNPAWARPFELFSRALGMPAATEADPSPVLAVAVPLMFGYMFGDVGQGLVIAAVGAALRKRSPIARLLMVGGLSAALFGLLFGSVFSLHGLIPALWLHPLDAPLSVLLAPLVGGALLLTLGLLLDALAAHWRGEFLRWCLTDAALIAVYLCLLAALRQPAALPLAGLAALWFCVGHGLVQRRVGAAFGALGEAVEKTLQIGINTLSFARVGAFALAHAGLSSALVALMDAAQSLPAKVLVFVLGNALVIVLEAMVVSIQTTRLVLFEFFTRFMQGQGRAFRPLPAPPFPHTSMET
jgi:V/A-type H+/Na+-transporting ATPase subunit I